MMIFYYKNKDQRALHEVEKKECSVKVKIHLSEEGLHTGQQ